MRGANITLRDSMVSVYCRIRDYMGMAVLKDIPWKYRKDDLKRLVYGWAVTIFLFGGILTFFGMLWMLFF